MGATPFYEGVATEWEQLHFMCGKVGCQAIGVSKKRALKSYHSFTLLKSDKFFPV